MNKMYSVKLLFESTTKSQYTARKIFEERIILVRTTSKEKISPIINHQFPVDRYENSEGGWTTVKLVAIYRNKKNKSHGVKSIDFFLLLL